MAGYRPSVVPVYSTRFVQAGDAKGGLWTPYTSTTLQQPHSMGKTSAEQKKAEQSKANSWGVSPDERGGQAVPQTKMLSAE